MSGLIMGGGRPAINKMLLGNVNPIWTRKQKHFLGAGQTAITNTFNTIMQAPCKSFTHVRMILPNLEASPPTLEGALIAVTSQAGNATQKTSPATGSTVTNDGETGWQTVTFGGAAQPVLPAANAHNSDPGILVSDWIPLSSIAPTDGSVFPYIIGRVKFQETVSTYTTVNFTQVTPSTVKDKDIYAETFYWVGNGISSPSSFSPGTQQDRTPILGFEFLSASPVVKIACIGDSITAGEDTSGSAIDHYGWPSRAQEILAAQNVPVNFFNYGYGGATTPQILTFGKKAIDRHLPAIALYSVFSPNDGSPNSASYVNTQIRRAMEFANHCFSKGTLPVMTFLAPGDAYNTTHDNHRKSLINYFKNSRMAVCDMTPAVGDGATPERFIPARGSGDGIHPNAAGYAEMAVIAADTIRSIVSQNLSY